jgi:hypothetical protein
MLNLRGIFKSLVLRFVVVSGACHLERMTALSFEALP